MTRKCKGKKTNPKQFFTDTAEEQTFWHFSSSPDIKVITEIQSHALQLELGLSKLPAYFSLWLGWKVTENQEVIKNW